MGAPPPNPRRDRLSGGVSGCGWLLSGCCREQRCSEGQLLALSALWRFSFFYRLRDGGIVVERARDSKKRRSASLRATLPAAAKWARAALEAAGAEVHLGARGFEERVVGEPIDVGDRVHRRERRVRTFGLSDRDRAVQRDDRRRLEADEHVVERDDAPEVHRVVRRRDRVLIGDRRLDVPRGRDVADRRTLELGDPAADELRVEAAPILRLAREQLTVRVATRREPRGRQAHQREERARRGRGRDGRLGEQRREPNRLEAELVAHRAAFARAVVALVEEEIERPVNRAGVLRDADGRDLRQAPRLGEDRLAALDALLHRGLAGEERVGDLFDGEAAQEVQDQRDLRLLRRGARGSSRTSSGARRRGAPRRRTPRRPRARARPRPRPATRARARGCARSSRDGGRRWRAASPWSSATPRGCPEARRSATCRAPGRARRAPRPRRAAGCARRRPA